MKIESTSGGSVIAIRVVPRASQPGLAGTRGDALLVRLSAPPVDGAANAELIALLAAVLHVPKRAVSIVAGARGREKRIRIDGLEKEALAARLAQVSSGWPNPST